MGKRFQRQDGENMQAFQARIAAVQSAERVVVQQRTYRRKRFKQQESALRASADHIDGFDRDDLGLSPDF